ncbi:alpha/beta fold hydrolase [Denitratisoma sp. DHT3]|uniref:alpha/beta fold hydrolase n=1 Tax=Denitratisoma sp. DHT3 TaxID=1981880 RepID=UPI00164850DE|nr:alpha/beta hydrolase [Denitratisoma sp. DHT3]
MTEPHGRHFDSQRLRLHYADWGNADAPLVLMVHGGYDHCRSWDWMAAGLRADWRVIAPDLRGHGDSDWDTGGAYLLLNHVYDLARLVDHLQAEKVRIVGHSFGGFISLLYAALFPERTERALVIDPFIHYTPRRLRAQHTDAPAEVAREWFERAGRAEKRGTRPYPNEEEAMARLAVEHPHLSADQVRHLTVHGLKRKEGGLYWKYDPYLAAMPPQFLSGPETTALWPNVTCPVLFLRGDACGEHSDPQRNGALDLFPDARSITIPGAGHWVHHNQLERVLEEARRFL